MDFFDTVSEHFRKPPPYFQEQPPPTYFEEELARRQELARRFHAPYEPPPLPRPTNEELARRFHERELAEQCERELAEHRDWHLRFRAQQRARPALANGQLGRALHDALMSVPPPPPPPPNGLSAWDARAGVWRRA